MAAKINAVDQPSIGEPRVAPSGAKDVIVLRQDDITVTQHGERDEREVEGVVVRS